MAPGRATASVPSGWVERTLGDLCSVITDGTHRTPTYVARGIPFYSVESVTRDDFANVKYISLDEHRLLTRRCRPQRGDILMTRIGSLAETKLIDWDVEASIYVSLALLRPGPQVDRRYLYAFTKSRSFVRSVEDRALLWAIPKKINMGDIAHVPVLLPLDASEQEAIGDALQILQTHIEALEQLVVKKQSMKQGVMQQLLTGRSRLPGFTEPWVDVRLGDIARVKTGSRNTQDKQPLGRYPFYVRSTTVERINSYSYDCEAILVPGEGGIGSIFHYANGRFEVHQRVYMISDFAPHISGQFIFFYMRQFFGAHAMERSVKATVDSLRLPTFNGFALHLPARLNEQKAIAAALADVQDEIDGLSRRVEKAKSVRTGIMQGLLAGRTRVPLTGGVL